MDDDLWGNGDFQFLAFGFAHRKRWDRTDEISGITPDGGIDDEISWFVVVEKDIE